MTIILISDSGYPIKPFLWSKLSVASTHEQLCNESLIRTRSCVERSFGMLKLWFLILSVGNVENIKVKAVIVESTCNFSIS